MSVAETFEQRAQLAGASLRAAFLEGEHMTTQTMPKGREPVQREARRKRRETRALAAAAAVAVLAAGAAGLVAVTGSEEPPAEVLPAVEQPAEPVVLQGLRDVPDFPVTMTVPPSLVETDADAGSRGFELVEDAKGGVVISGISSVDGQPVSMPQDVPALLAERDDLTVTDLGTRRVAGQEGQAFRLEQVPGGARRDVWCPIKEERLCFRVFPGRPMDVVVVPTSAEPLWIAWEYAPEDRLRVQAAAEELLESLRVE